MATAYLKSLYDAYRANAKIGKDEMESWTYGEAPSAERRKIVDDAYAAVQTLKKEIDKVQGFDELRKAGDAFYEVAAPVVERATGRKADGLSIRELFTTATATGFATGEFSIAAPSAVRALATSSSTVETSFSDLVTVYARTLTPMLNPSVVTLKEYNDGSPKIYPKLTADPTAGGTVTAEAGGITLADATLSSFTLNPYKFATIEVLSRELFDDAAIPVETILAESQARAISLGVGGVMTTGDGSSKPQGFVPVAVNGGTATGTSTTAGTHFGYTDLIDLFYGRSAPVRENGSWMANATTLAAIRKQRDENGQLIWQPSTAAGQPETVLGRPIYENPDMASGSAAKAVAFGDFSKFVVQVTPWRVETSIGAYFGTDQVGIRSILRADSDLADAGAIAVLVNAAV